MIYVTAFYAFFFSLLYFSSVRAILGIMFLNIVLRNKKKFVAHINKGKTVALVILILRILQIEQH